MGSKNKFASVLAVTVLAVLGATLSACGDSSSSEKEEAVDLSAANLGEKAAANIKVSPRTIGVVNLIRSSPGEDKTDRFLEAVAPALGWNIEIVDGGGDPNKMATAAQTFVNKGVDALITTSVDAAAIRKGLTEAKSKGIPAIGIEGGTTPSDLFAAQYEEDESELARQLALYMKETIKDPQIANLTTAIAYSGVLRDEALKEVFPTEIVAEAEVDQTNPVVDTQAKLTSMFTAHPDINAVWPVYDNMSQAAAKTIEQKNSEAKLYSFFTSPANVKLFREESPLVAVSDVDLQHTAGVAIDQLLAYFEENTPIDPNALEKNPLTYEVVTRENVEEKLGNKNTLFPNSTILKPFLSEWEEKYPAN